MRLLFVLNELPYPAHRNGVALINHALLTRTPSHCQVDLAIGSHAEPETEQLLRQDAPRIDTIHYLGPASARRFRVGNLLSGALLGHNLFELPALVSLLSSAQRWDSIYVAPLMSFFDFRRVRPVVLNAVDSFARLNDSAWRARRRPIDLVKRTLYEHYEARVLRDVACTCFVSSTDVAAVQARNPRLPLVCIPNGVDSAWFSPTDTARDPATLLFTGNFGYEPNRDAALYLARTILPLIRAVRPDVRLQVVGRDPPQALVGLRGIVVSGFVDDIRAAYRAGTVFVCPLRSGAGIKNKILEAMACGIPIVSSSLGVDGIDAMLSGQHYVRADSPEDFARAVLELLDQRPRREELAQAARALVSSRMDWNQVASAYFAQLHRVAALVAPRER